MRLRSEGLRLRLILAAIVAAVILFVILHAERELLYLFDALVAHHEARTEWVSMHGEAAGAPGGLEGGFGTADACDPAPGVDPLDSEVRAELKVWFPQWPAPTDGLRRWGAFNLYYLGQLGYTLLLLLPVGLFVAALGFISAVVLFRLHRGGRSGWARSLDTLLDALPYILWVFPVLSLAYCVWDQPWGIHWPYWFYLMILFFGFAVFLLPFFIQTDLRRLLGLERSGVLDGERVTGVSELRIYLRLLRFELRRLFAYQVLYAVLFAMLLEFSAFEIIEFNQPRAAYTVFTQGNIYLNLANKARKYAHADRPLSHRDLMSRVVTDIAPPPGAGWARRLAVTPAAALDPAVRVAALAHLQGRPNALSGVDAETLGRACEQGQADQRELFFAVIADFYFWSNTALVFGLFAALLIGFDLRAYAEETHG